jgi:hypothetical protein
MNKCKNLSSLTPPKGNRGIIEAPCIVLIYVVNPSAGTVCKLYTHNIKFSSESGFTIR